MGKLLDLLAVIIVVIPVLLLLVGIAYITFFLKDGWIIFVLLMDIILFLWATTRLLYK